MPIYEYECRDCGYRLDALQKMSDPPLTDCPECTQPSLKKLLSAPYFRLKGSGWYETDFKHSGSKKPDEGTQDGESKASSGDGKEAGEEAGKEARKEAGKEAGKSKTDSSGSDSGSATSGAAAS